MVLEPGLSIQVTRVQFPSGVLSQQPASIKGRCDIYRLGVVCIDQQGRYFTFDRSKGGFNSHRFMLTLNLKKFLQIVVAISMKLTELEKEFFDPSVEISIKLRYEDSLT